MKWDSLGYGEQNHLKKLYDAKYEQPVKPEFDPPQSQRRTVVESSYKTDIYCRMIGNAGSRFNQPGEASAEVRVVGSGEHVRVEIETLDGLQKFITELKRLADDIEMYNAELRAHNERVKQFEAAKDAYERKREANLREALSSGKYTFEQIQAWKLDDIPF
jgi:hypothetical protein